MPLGKQGQHEHTLRRIIFQQNSHPAGRYNNLYIFSQIYPGCVIFGVTILSLPMIKEFGVGVNTVSVASRFSMAFALVIIFIIWSHQELTYFQHCSSCLGSLAICSASSLQSLFYPDFVLQLWLDTQIRWQGTGKDLFYCNSCCATFLLVLAWTW